MFLPLLSALLPRQGGGTISKLLTKPLPQPDATVYLSIINVGWGWRWRWKIGDAAAAVLLLVPLAVLDDEPLLRDVRVHQLGHAELLLHLPENRIFPSILFAPTMTGASVQCSPAVLLRCKPGHGGLGRPGIRFTFNMRRQ